MGVIKDIVEWKYERASWQWDVLCLLILAFIFFTPKTWFNKNEKLATKTVYLVVKANDVPTDRTVLENKVKELTENPKAEIINLREKKDSDGQTIYEIDVK